MQKTLWLILAILSLCIGLYPFVYFMVDPLFGLLSTKSDVLWQQQGYRAGFYTHIICGGITLLSGWAQFNGGWRRQRPALHRNLGKIYLLAMLPAALAGIYLSFHATGGWITGTGFFLLGIVWLGSSAAAYSAIRRADIRAHERWMVFSYAACFAAVTLRIWLPLLVILNNGDFVPAYQLVAWLCWVPNLLFAGWYTARKI
jgi:uncharacterized membrane protein